MVAREANGWGLAAQWADDLHHALHATLTGERDGYYADFGRLGDVARVLRKVHLHGGERSPMRRRVHGRAVPDEIPGHRFVVCSQNHDQVGNRASGERLAHLVGVDAALVAATLVLTSPGTPLLFQGEEWAASTPWPYFCDVPSDPALAEAIRQGRRREFAAFGWVAGDVPDPLAVSTAAGAVLRREERSMPDHARALEWYRTLLALRRRLPGLVDGDRASLSTMVDEEARTLAVQRPGVVVAANLGPAAARVAWPGGQPSAAIAACSRPGGRLVGRAVALPGVSAAIVLLAGAVDGPEPREGQRAAQGA